MSARYSYPCLFPVVTAVFLGAFFPGNVVSQDSEKLTEIPPKLFQVQDSEGFFWQAAGNGALTSGGTQYLQSGLNLIVADEPFAPSSAEVRAPGDGVETVDAVFEEKREEITIERDLWFDAERAGVRVLDTITNTAEVSQTIPVEMRTTYPFGWQSLHDLEGDLLSNEPTLSLKERDMGFVVRFSPSEGRHDTVLLTASESGGLKPELTASANSRELTMSYDLVLKAGESKSLLHWILQRNVPELSESGADTARIAQRGRLIRPGIEVDEFGSIANFSEASFSDDSTAPPQLRSLVALNSLTDRIGFHRRSDDLLWINSTNQISGKVNRAATLTIQAAYLGERTLSMSKVAAIRGGAGIGRAPHVYLRDGQVLVGAVSAEGLGMFTGDDGDPLDIERINLLLLGTEPNDGAAPADTAFFLQMKDGTVVAASGGKGDGLTFATEWGIETYAFPAISELGYLTVPTPRWRLVDVDGSRFSGFLTGEPLTLNLSDGAEVEVPPVAIQKVWGPGNSQSTIIETADAWLDFAEVPEGVVDGEGFLLAGNNLLRGSLGDDYLTLLQDQTALKIAGDRVTSISRRFDAGVSGKPVFQIGLDNGDRLEGALGGAYVTIQREGRIVKLPIDRLIAFRKTDS